MARRTTVSRDDVAVQRALGLHHTLVTAIADLVDNSVDAGARNVVIRFLNTGHATVGLRVIDNGAGMDDVSIDAAMRYGTERVRRDDEHGHFGVGLKAASLSQADEVTVYSSAKGHRAVARRLRVAGRGDVPVVEALPADVAESTVAAAHPRFPFETGTVVEWRGLRTFPMTSDHTEQSVWLETAIKDAQAWLGLVFHRMIERGLALTIDVFDTATLRAGAPRTVRAIDPFGYQRSGASGYPRDATIDVGPGSTVALHVWPARSSLPAYTLDGASGRSAQGFFVYRNDRLLQPGGWLGVVRPRPEWALARVAVDLDDALVRHMTINPEKAGVTVDATLSSALRRVLTPDYLADAATAAKAARRVQRRPITVVEPGAGLPDAVADEFADSFTFTDTADPVDIGWRVLSVDRFFEVDLEARTLWLNARFRRQLGGTSRSNDDVPLLRTLTYLLAQEMFDSVRHSSRQTEQIEAWQHVLIAAMRAQEGNGR
ncbi:ATPase [Gordonia sp. 852002-50816_SCH5313054-c]|nr:ATPase [Gordonia sp. 852002-50816_SCH5313054-a]OBC12689.1 ATPase [Gordonia sp. 852002-50816_SCH5313054-c]